MNLIVAAEKETKNQIKEGRPFVKKRKPLKENKNIKYIFN